ncbi:MAG: galactokinase [Opitutaceae bacterium]
MKEKLIAEFHALHGRAPTVIARAPGRLEFIGNHTDYNGGTVLGASIDRSVWVAVAPREDGQWRFGSGAQAALVTLAAGDSPAQQSGANSWANYPLGVIAALPKFGRRTPAAFDFFAMSDLPSGAGLSSSAALELASALAFLALSGQDAPRETIVNLCRSAENNFVGVPCGVLDQGVSGFGKKDHLVFIDCRGPKFATVPLPGAARFWVFNTHTKHALVDGLYAARYRECMAAAKSLGVALLADATPESVEAARSQLPPVEFRRAKHVVEEIARVAAAVVALRAGDLTAVGRLLTASHRSSQTLFENSTPELDFLVDQLATAPRVYGARLTGGGFGGAVMAVTAPDFREAQAAAVADAYAKKFGTRPEVLRAQTGEGATLIQT